MFPELLLTVLMYAVLAAALLLIAAVISLCVPKARKSKKTFCRILLLCLVLETVSLFLLSRRPILICPEEYREQISEDEKQQIIGFNAGLYSGRIPFVPLCIVVENADEDEILVRTRYFPFGHTEMAVNDDGPDPRRGIFGGN